MLNNFTQLERQAVLNMLRLGRAQAIGARQLAGLVHFPNGGNQVKLRNLIKECIEIDGDLIGAAIGRPAGFFIINTLQELEMYMDSLEKRTRSDNDRRTALLNSWNANNRQNGSLRLTLRIV